MNPAARRRGFFDGDESAFLTADKLLNEIFGKPGQIGFVTFGQDENHSIQTQLTALLFQCYGAVCVHGT